MFVGRLLGRALRKPIMKGLCAAKGEKKPMNGEAFALETQQTISGAQELGFVLSQGKRAVIHLHPTALTVTCTREGSLPRRPQLLPGGAFLSRSLSVVGELPILPAAGESERFYLGEFPATNALIFYK